MENSRFRFRAWDKPDKLMYYNVQNGIKFDDGSKYTFEDYLDDRGYHEWVIMQYTGLKDKNGKEIYEGNLYRDRYENLYKVKYEQDSCQFLLRLVSNSSNAEIEIELTSLNISVFKYAGTVHENPELLEG